MAREWTKSQRAAIDLRGKMILVSAAAGSGKTSVLTERIIQTLTDREHPADLSRLLVVTFTRAAAAELKGRIAAALTEALAEHPDDTHLSRQLFLLGSAQISTIDAFFQQAVRANFEQLELPASFRMADQTELVGLSLEVLDGVIRELYDRHTLQNPTGNDLFSRLLDNRFAKIMDHFLSHRNDKELDRTLLEFHSKFASYPEGIKILMRIARDLRTQMNGEFFRTDAGKIICKHIEDALNYYAEGLKAAGDYLAIDEKAAGYFSGTHAADTDYVVALTEAIQAGCYEDARRVAVTYPKASFPTMQKKPAEMDAYKKLHDSLKAAAADFCKSYFAWSPQEIAWQMQQTADTCEMLFLLFSEYEARILEEKKARGVLEFDDVREQLYRLLLKPNGEPSEFARSLSDQYDAVYIDEYQDVDDLQDRIFSIIGENRRFMVGDIKQSIYGFRGSEPSIFSSYRRSMPLYETPEAESSDAVCVFMSENFRCNQPIIDFANHVCAFLFSACEQSVGYREQDDLKFSKKPTDESKAPPVPAKVQTVLFEPYPKKKRGEKATPDDRERPKREAVWIAAEISRLMREERLDNGSKIQASDVAILVRTAAQGNAIAAELEKLNIPVSAPAAEDPLHSPIMTQTLNLLRAIDNPHRDLPLSEYLLSADGGFSLDELTEIRDLAPNEKSLYDAICEAAADKANPHTKKAAEWVTWLEAQRRVAAVQSADRFLRLLYLDPRVAPHASEAELLLLYEQARLYQRTSWCGLYGFLSHVSKLLEGKPISIGGFRKATGAVTVMTIHHSKGLEFPVVFLASCGVRFNNESLQKNLLFHRKAGCASKLYHSDLRANKTSILREAVKLEIKADETEEAIRTLYVALTRARERLYVTATTEGKIDTALSSAAMLRRGSRYSILSGNSYLRWILAALQEKRPNSSEFPCIFRNISLSDEITGLPIDTANTCNDSPAAASEAPSNDMQAYLEILGKQADFAYPSIDLSDLPTKIAASKIRTDLLNVTDDERDESGRGLELQIELMRAASPSFEILLNGRNQPQATDIGTAMHSFLEFCDLTTLSEHGVEAEIGRLVSEAFISAETANLLNRKQLKAFASSELIEWAKKAKRIYREQTFSLLLPLSSLTTIPQKQKAWEGETVFVQGSIDLILQMEDDRILLFDYKTDRIDEAIEASPAHLLQEMITHHGNQLACYARAIENLFGKKPNEIFVYALALGQAISIPLDRIPLF